MLYIGNLKKNICTHEQACLRKLLKKVSSVDLGDKQNFHQNPELKNVYENLQTNYII